MRKNILPIVLIVLIFLLLFPLMALASSTDVVRNESTGSTYSTLIEAVNAANSGDALTLLADVKVTSMLVIDKELTIDFGTYTVSSDAASNLTTVIYNNDANLTLKGTTGGVKAGSNWYAVYSYHGTLNIEYGNYESVDRTAIYGYAATVNISGGTFRTDSSITILGTAGSTVTLEGDAHVYSGNSTNEDACVRLVHSTLNLHDNPTLEGVLGVYLKTEDLGLSSLYMDGGTIITSRECVTLQGSQSAGCKATITGGTLTTIGTCPAIYWPADDTELTIGGDAAITGYVGVDARRGTVTIRDNAVITATGDYKQANPVSGDMDCDGSALQLGTQLYEGNLTVNLEGGKLVSEKGNAITIINLQQNSSQAQITLSDTVVLEGARRLLELLAPTETDASFNSSGGLLAVSAQTSLTVPAAGDFVAARSLTAEDGRQALAFFNTLDDALNAGSGGEVFLLADVSLSQVVLTDPNLTFTVAPGITLTFTASNPSYSVRAVRNADGSISYTLVPVSPAPDPDDPLGTLDGDPYSYYEPLPDAGAKQLLQTGDHTPLALYLLLALACASVIAVMARRGRGRS